MNLIKAILTKNPCYTSGRKIKPKGAVLHSIGCPQPNAKVLINDWNRTDYNRACVHAFVDANTGDIYQTLPWDHRGWHGGGSVNNTHVGVEMCEPDCIQYVPNSSRFTCSNAERAREMVRRTYNSSVELFAQLCKDHGWNPLVPGVIISHSEGYKMGVASNHGDPEHLWKGLGLPYTMDGFRKDVKAAMDGAQPSDSIKYRVQTGAYRDEKNAKAQVSLLKNAGFDCFIIFADGWHKIQIGAYSVYDNAKAHVEKLKKAGFDAIITTKGGEAVADSSPAPAPEAAKKEIKIDSTVRLRKGAKDFSGGSLASFVYGRDHKVLEINCDRVVITYKGVVVAAVRKSDLTVVD